MLDAIRAETLKLGRHRATWLMVWIFPIGFFLVLLAQISRDLFQGAAVDTQALSAATWIQQSTTVWEVPLQGGGRFIIAGFAALVFAGEYGWNTWKLVIPARTRWQLIAAKWIVCPLLLLSAFLAADLIGLVGSIVRSALGGPSIPEGVTFSALIDAHSTAAANAVIPMLYTIAWAGLFAVFTTSVLATVILSIGLVVLEQLLLPAGIVVYGFIPSLTAMLLDILPMYHLANLIAWTKGSALILPLGPNATIAVSRAVSTAWVLAWIGVAGALTIGRFSRQDMN